MGTFYMMVGLPASGKSTKAKEIASNIGAILVESDNYRKELYGNESIQGDNHKLFQIIQDDVIRHLKNGHSVIMDATNTSRKRRVSFLQKINKLDVGKVCVFMATSIPLCMEYNNDRDRKVPVDVIMRYWKTFNIPLYTEGWDFIDVYLNYDLRRYSIDDFIDRTISFDQRNPYHSRTLGEHSLAVSRYMTEVNKVDAYIATAALLHDNGKEYTMRFKNNKGEKTEIAHYYSHENVGAYESLFYLDVNHPTLPYREMLFCAGLIEYHMRPYNAQSDKAKKKLLDTVGEDMNYFLWLLHEADKESH